MAIRKSLVSSNYLCWLAILVVAIANSMSLGEEPDIFPVAKEGWSRVQYEAPTNNLQWRFKVFRNEKSGDLLSFASKRTDSTKPVILERWADTTGEVCPIGHPFWSKVSRDSKASTYTLKYGVDDFYVDGGRQGEDLKTLLYINIVEVSDEENRMACGFLFVEKDHVLVVQHTSMRPITDQLVKEATMPLVKNFNRLEELFND